MKYKEAYDYLKELLYEMLEHSNAYSDELIEAIRVAVMVLEDYVGDADYLVN